MCADLLNLPSRPSSMQRMADTLTAATESRTARETVETACPHCHKRFEATIDSNQPPRLQGAKCPNCKLFVPARIVQAAFAD